MGLFNNSDAIQQGFGLIGQGIQKYHEDPQNQAASPMQQALSRGLIDQFGSVQEQNAAQQDQSSQLQKWMEMIRNGADPRAVAIQAKLQMSGVIPPGPAQAPAPGATAPAAASASPDMRGAPQAMRLPAGPLPDQAQAAWAASQQAAPVEAPAAPQPAASRNPFSGLPQVKTQADYNNLLQGIGAAQQLRPQKQSRSFSEEVALQLLKGDQKSQLQDDQQEFQGGENAKREQGRNQRFGANLNFKQIAERFREAIESGKLAEAIRWHGIMAQKFSDEKAKSESRTSTAILSKAIQSKTAEVNKLRQAMADIAKGIPADRLLANDAYKTMAKQLQTEQENLRTLYSKRADMEMLESSVQSDEQQSSAPAEPQKGFLDFLK